MAGSSAVSRASKQSKQSEPTPIPGSYPVRDFLEDAQLNPVNLTYSFKGEGRKRMSIYQQPPDLTLPDTCTYLPPSFVQLAQKRRITYAFKNTSRQSPISLTYRDKELYVSIWSPKTSHFWTDTDTKNECADIIDASVPPVNNTQNSGAKAKRKYRDFVINIKQAYQLESL
ncbi:hypothetical protein JD844_025434 [Phrynosoma platyrhinos]|uniref:Uncharacterized protein n=1 Tax=Phrynosoma platyrhinos TaxID=52577 RepID=A0ABQ7T0E7_PHRPL|nr:hypothetical protein JD844_025434 [Phrynosoma platyrhinos]